MHDSVFMRILLTEDNPVLADLLIDFLQDEGHEVARVSDPDGAGELIRAITWDAWLIDPSGSGFAEPDARCVAHLQCLGAYVPIVLTASQLWARRISPAELGVYAILQKPYDLGDLERILESIRF